MTLQNMGQVGINSSLKYLSYTIAIPWSLQLQFSSMFAPKQQNGYAPGRGEACIS